MSPGPAGCMPTAHSLHLQKNFSRHIVRETHGEPHTVRKRYSERHSEIHKCKTHSGTHAVRVKYTQSERHTVRENQRMSMRIGIEILRSFDFIITTTLGERQTEVARVAVSVQM